MAARSACLLVAVFCLFGLTAGQEGSSQAVGILVRELLKSYSRLDKPLRHYPALVTHDLTIGKLKDLDVEDQSMSLLVWESMGWVDTRLSWFPESHNDVQEIVIPPELIWTPDITLYNAYDRPKKLQDVFAYISSGGSVTLIVPKMIQTLCNTTQNSDVQTCKINYGSWTLNTNSIDLKAKGTTPDMSYYMPHPIWNLEEATVARDSIDYGTFGKYAYITYSLVFRRENDDS